MKRVTGLGGVFFKAQKPKELQKWYETHLGIELDSDGFITFKWREKDTPNQIGHTVWGPFQGDTQYFEPSKAPFMFNFRVDDLDALLDELRKEGVLTLREEGVRLALDGRSSLEEILTVTHSQDTSEDVVSSGVNEANLR